MKTDLLDPRQSRAAALILTAVDMPCELQAYANLISRVGSLIPNATSAECSETKRQGLERARDLINEMLAEMPA